MFSILKRRSFWYFIISTVVYVALLMFFNAEGAKNMLIMSVVPINAILSLLFTIVYLFAILWCFGAKWEEDKYIKRKTK